ncbi:hypothetical protein K2173_020622 [Erythroxylum novogranatense]|uniref:Protein kinase domain-containing protein n=1 Tax=Erythroxylum novogranatense TaxID=1862640 RepID=A0AAV8TGU9_9ROSI|nr:hypothetical protein K2173_020622 [Erythroxylum novogranatense]
MSSRAPSSFFLLTALLLTCAVLVLSANQCPDCGPTAVPYPLSTGPKCGDQSYKIRCNSGSLIFDTVNNSYPIISVNSTSQRLVIEPATLSPNTCVTTDYTHHGIQLNETLPFNITSSNTIMYLNCNKKILSSPLNCTSSSLCHLYVNNTKASLPCRDAPICCTLMRAGSSTTEHMIRVRDAGCKAYASFVDLNPNMEMEQWPNPGVEMQWALPPEPKCESQVDCDEKSTCGPDPNDSGPGTKRCFCKEGSRWDPLGGICAENSHGHRSEKTAIISGLMSCLGIAFLVAISSIAIYRKHESSSQDRLRRERQNVLNAGGNRVAKIFSGKEIMEATNKFSKERLLGVGGYGEVYKGILKDGTLVAVKCAKLGNTKGTHQVINEVRILCQVNHRCLVSLLGCCVDLDQPIMVYQYIPNGTLLDHLQGLRPGGRGQLSWIHRLRIAHDTAQALAYLHFAAVPPIYHRDIKSSNILLDEKLNAKVSDFGLSRLAYGDLSHISTCAQGTLGYLDPEYYRKYQLTDKSDVYSFGVVLLELLTSQKAIDFNRMEDDVNLAVYVQRMAQEERLMDVIDPILTESAKGFDFETIKALAYLSLSCVEEKRQNRPSMKEAVEEIEYILSVAMTVK